jgi:trehalose 6-phosphate synthase
VNRLVIVSNRTPNPRERSQLAGGLAVGLKEALHGRDALWFGWSGTCVEDGAPTEPKLVRSGRITHATLDLAQNEYSGYYRGYSNATLWPLLHSRLETMDFCREHLAAYHAVNEAFAAALAPMLRPDDLVWAHDYHLFYFAAALRRQGFRGRIGFFLHVPFPPPTVFTALPQGAELLVALAAYDVIGMQTAEDATNLDQNFAANGIDAHAEAFPIGIDPKGFAEAAAKEAAGPETERLHASLGNRRLILGVDRLDYTKGLPQRFRGYAQLLRRFPEHRNQVTFMQVAPVSRGDVAQYRALRKELDELAGRINGEHAEFDWVPLRYITRTVPRNTLAGFFRAAKIGLVTPLRDGMNLVAKEYVAAQDPADPGALVLSRFAGAASAMEGALIVNPYDPDETAEGLHAALTMGAEERRSRWKTMDAAIHRHTAAEWGRAFLARLEDHRAQAA